MMKKIPSAQTVQYDTNQIGYEDEAVVRHSTDTDPRRDHQHIEKKEQYGQSDERYPIRSPTAEEALQKLRHLQSLQLEEFKNRIESDEADRNLEGGKENEDEALAEWHRSVYDGWDAAQSSDDEQPRLSLSEMKYRVEKANKAALKAATQAHQASIASSIAAEATKDAQNAAYRAMHAASRCQNALERRASEVIKESYTSAMEAEDKARKEATRASKFSAESVMAEASAQKNANEAEMHGLGVRPHGVIEMMKAARFHISSKLKEGKANVGKAWNTMSMTVESVRHGVVEICFNAIHSARNVLGKGTPNKQ